MAWDHVIIGGGSAGCVVAGRLASAHKRVLLLEAGPSDRSPFIHVPAGLLKLRDIHWGYQDEPDASRNGQQMTWMAGRVLGGGSSVNGMVWVRGNPADYDHWAALGCEGWGFTDVLPYFKQAETFIQPGDDQRGHHGPVHVGYSRVDHPLTRAFIASGENVGHKGLADYNSVEQEGIGICQTNQWRGFRHSTARAYLKGAWHRPNLEVRTDCTVTRILFDGRRAIGVEYEHGGARHRELSDGDVVLAAGALASPKILMLSGVGPGAALQAKGVEVVHDLPGVGANLQEHPIATMLWNSRIPTLNTFLNPAGVIRYGLEFVARGTGPGASAAGHALLFGKLRPDADRPDYEGLFAPYGMVGADAGNTTGEVLEGPGEHDVSQMEMLSRPSFTVIAQLLHPRARGRIELRDNDPSAHPVIRHRLMEDADVEDLIQICRIMRNVVKAKPLSDNVIGEALPGPAVESDSDWEAYLRSAAWGAQHPVGTCKMGVDDLAVVDPQLRVRGVTGLRIADASIMPTLTSGNTNAPTIMIGEKAAALIAS